MIFPDQADRIMIATKPPLVHARMRCRLSLLQAAIAPSHCCLQRLPPLVAACSDCPLSSLLAAIAGQRGNWATGQRVVFRKGHDGLASMAQAELGFAPKAGVMVVFRSKRGDRVKVLFWNGSRIVAFSPSRDLLVNCCRAMDASIACPLPGNAGRHA